MERRLKQRFPLVLGLRYSIGGTPPSLAGAARTENISSSGLFFRCNDANPGVGSPISLEVDLPGDEPLVLLISGQVSRSNSSGVAVQFARGQFGDVEFTAGTTRLGASRRFRQAV